MFALAPLAASLISSAGSALAGAASSSLQRTLDAVGGTDAAGKSAAGKPAANARAKKTAQDFEQMFLEQTMDRVNGSEGSEGPLGENGTGGGIYRSMMNKEYAGAIVRSGGVGISDQVYKQMLAMQEAGAARAGA